MIITYFGKQYFKITQGDLTVAFNPISKSSKFKGTISRFGADIALVTTHHADYDGVENLSHGEKEPFVIEGPGEYEVNDIIIKGVVSEFTDQEGKKINTAYSLSIDDISILFLGALTSDLTAEAKGEIERPDIVFVPVSSDMLGFAKAYKIASSFEPKIIIPMEYGEDLKSAELKSFLKEAQSEDAKPIEKLTLKRKELEGKDGEIVLLSC